ncbi:MAG: alpha/beta hydrolase [Alphaproteobacteria bacterium]
MLRGLARLAVMAVAVYVMVTAGMYTIQRQMMYHPPAAVLRAPPAGFQAVTLATADGLSLAAWHAPAPAGARTIVHFHGNAGLISGQLNRVLPLVAAGYGVLLVEYRGYGGNPGEPTEDGLLADGRAALAYLDSLGVAASDRVLIGESLGTGVAVAMAAEAPAAGLILLAPYTSTADVAQARYWWLPARWLIKDSYDSLSRIRRVRTPLLIVHGRRDATIDVRFGERLFEAANEPKKLVVYDNAGHNDLIAHGVIEAELAFLAALP